MPIVLSPNKPCSRLWPDVLLCLHFVRALALVVLLAGIAVPAAAETPVPARQLGDYATCLGDTDEDAIAACDRALARHDRQHEFPDDELAMLYVSRAFGHLLAERPDAAIADADAAIRYDPSLATAFWTRGSGWQNKSVHDRAIADFSESIRLDPTDAFSFIKRGISRQSIGDLAGRDSDIAEATRLDPVLVARKYVKK